MFKPKAALYLICAKVQLAICEIAKDATPVPLHKNIIYAKIKKSYNTQTIKNGNSEITQMNIRVHTIISSFVLMYPNDIVYTATKCSMKYCHAAMLKMMNTYMF